MSQDVSTGDMIFGSAVLIIFLVLVFVAGKLLNEFKNRRFTKAWAPLVPLINGTITHDGGGAATSWLTGTYRGRPVRASMTPDRNRYYDETGFKYNYFDVALLEVAGKQDWSFVHKSPILGIGQHEWKIETQDETLAERLRQAGLYDALRGLSSPTLSYKARERTLLYTKDVTPRWTSTPEEFTQELDILLQVAKINTEANAG